MKRLLITLALVAAAGTALARSTPVGLWKTIDDEIKAEKSQVRITEVGGVLSGKVDKIADASKQDSSCDLCTDERRGQKLLGLTIIRGARLDGDKERWEGGEILDPNNGKVYKLLLKPIEGGRKLEVRGFIGLALLGRTQTWMRVE